MFTVCQRSFRYSFNFRCSTLLGRGSGCCGGNYGQDLNFSYFSNTRVAVTCIKAPLLAILKDPKELQSLWGRLRDLTVIPHRDKTWLYSSSLLPTCIAQHFPLEGNSDTGDRKEAQFDQVPDLGEQETRILQCSVLHNLGTA